MTLGELKRLVNSVEDKYNDEEIDFFFADEDGGIKCFYKPILDLYTYKNRPILSFTIFNNFRGYKEHSGNTPWSKFGKWFEDWLNAPAN